MCCLQIPHQPLILGPIALPGGLHDLRPIEDQSIRLKVRPFHYSPSLSRAEPTTFLEVNTPSCGLKSDTRDRSQSRGFLSSSGLRTNGNLQADGFLGQGRVNHGGLKEHPEKQEIFTGCQSILGKISKAGVSSHPPEEQSVLLGHSAYRKTSKTRSRRLPLLPPRELTPSLSTMFRYNSTCARIHRILHPSPPIGNSITMSDAEGNPSPYLRQRQQLFHIHLHCARNLGHTHARAGVGRLQSASWGLALLGLLLLLFLLSSEPGQSGPLCGLGGFRFNSAFRYFHGHSYQKSTPEPNAFPEAFIETLKTIPEPATGE